MWWQPAAVWRMGRTSGGRRAAWMLTSAAGLVLAGGAIAAPLAEEDFVQAVVARAPELAAIGHRARAQGLQAQQYVGLPDPSVRLTVTGVDLMFKMPPTVMIMAEQPVPLGEARSSGAQAARATAEAVAAEHPIATAELAWQARTVFAAWRSVHARRSILAHHVRMGDDIILAMKRQMATGGISAARLARVQSDVERLRVEAESAGALAAQLRVQLQAWLGESDVPEPALDLPSAPTAQADPGVAHPVLRRLAAQQGATQARVLAARAGSALTLMPGAGLMTGPDMPIGMLLTVGLRWPGFGSGQARLDAQAESARADGEALAADAQARARRIRAAMAQAWATMTELATRKQGLQTRVLPLAERAVQAAVPAVAAGSGAAVELAEAEHRLIDLELQLLALDDAWLAARARWIWLRDGDADAQGMSAPGAMSLPSAAVPEPTPGGMPGM